MEKNRISKRDRRHKRIRKKVAGTKARPRLSVFRSLKNINAQIIDDFEGRTLVSVSTFDKAIRPSLKYGGNVKAAEALGAIVAQKAKEKGISKVVLDRGGYAYHGRVKIFAEAARKAGLVF